MTTDAFASPRRGRARLTAALTRPGFQLVILIWLSVLAQFFFFPLPKAFNIDIYVYSNALANMLAGQPAYLIPDPWPPRSRMDVRSTTSHRRSRRSWEVPWDCFHREPHCGSRSTWGSWHWRSAHASRGAEHPGVPRDRAAPAPIGPAAPGMVSLRAKLPADLLRQPAGDHPARHRVHGHRPDEGSTVVDRDRPGYRCPSRRPRRSCSCFHCSWPDDGGTQAGPS